ncbi:MAG: M23 family metallopeptidase [Candidatus Hodarchaeota archaeon]
MKDRNIWKLLRAVILVVIILASFVFIQQVRVVAETSDSLTGLYAATTNPGIVWKHEGDTTWESITEQPTELGWSVTSIITYEGKLYAASISDPHIYSSSGKVYRYEGSKKWTAVDNGLETNQITFLIVYKEELYAGTATPARLYRYNPATTSWTKVLEYTPWFGFRSAYVWGDWLYLGEWYYDRFARWNGVNFDEFQPYHWGSCIYSIEEYGSHLYAGAYGGVIYKVTSEPKVTTIWNQPNWQYAWSLKTFQNKLYMGFDAGWTGNAPLYKYDGINPPTQVWSYSTTTYNQHEGIISMVTDGTYLYVGVGGQAVGYPSYMWGGGIGKVYRSSDGINFQPASESMGSGIQSLLIVPKLIRPVEGEVICPFRGYYKIKEIPKGDNRLDTIAYKFFHEKIGEVIKDGIVYYVYKVYHEGIDINGMVEGDPVKAAASGTVVYVDNVDNSNAGKYIWIRHGDIMKLDGTLASKISTRYLHLDTIHSNILQHIPNPTNFQGEVNIPITQGTVIGTVGDTGCPGIPHLHFEVRQGDIPSDYNHRNTYPLNPCDFISLIGCQSPHKAFFSASCPVDLNITDPDGLIISKEINQLPTSSQYIEMKYSSTDDEEESLQNYDSIIISECKIGDYLIAVTPEPESNPSDTYNLQVISAGVTSIFAENVQVSNIPTYPYILRLTESEIIPIIPATIDIDPDTLNRNSTGKWITCYFELPTGHGYNIEDINISTILLNEAVPAEDHPTNISDYDEDGMPDLMVKFGRQNVTGILETGENVAITVAGELFDGTRFEGVDYIRVI